jgi:hypothetical protein
MQTLLFILIAYLLYRFIVGFVLPVATAASRIKKQFRDMQANQPQENSTTENINPTSFSNRFEKHRTTSGVKGSKEDYIDFEEVPVSKH